MNGKWETAPDGWQQYRYELPILCPHKKSENKNSPKPWQNRPMNQRRK